MNLLTVLASRRGVDVEGDTVLRDRGGERLDLVTDLPVRFLRADRRPHHPIECLLPQPERHRSPFRLRRRPLQRLTDRIHRDRRIRSSLTQITGRSSGRSHPRRIVFSAVHPLLRHPVQPALQLRGGRNLDARQLVRAGERFDVSDELADLTGPQREPHVAGTTIRNVDRFATLLGGATQRLELGDQFATDHPTHIGHGQTERLHPFRRLRRDELGGDQRVDRSLLSVSFGVQRVDEPVGDPFRFTFAVRVHGVEGCGGGDRTGDTDLCARQVRQGTLQRPGEVDDTADRACGGCETGERDHRGLDWGGHRREPLHHRRDHVDRPGVHGEHLLTDLGALILQVRGHHRGGTSGGTEFPLELALHVGGLLHDDREGRLCFRHRVDLRGGLGETHRDGPGTHRRCGEGHTEPFCRVELATQSGAERLHRFLRFPTERGGEIGTQFRHDDGLLRRGLCREPEPLE